MAQLAPNAPNTLNTSNTPCGKCGPGFNCSCIQVLCDGETVLFFMNIVQVNSENMNGGTQQEYILDDDECPLAILMNHPSARGKLLRHFECFNRVHEHV